MAQHRRPTVRAPSPDRRGWTAAGGWLDAEAVRQAVEAGDDVLVVNEAAELHTIAELPAPLLAAVRADGELWQMLDRLDDLGDRLAGLDTAVALLTHRVEALERRQR